MDWFTSKQKKLSAAHRTQCCRIHFIRGNVSCYW